MTYVFESSVKLWHGHSNGCKISEKCPIRYWKFSQYQCNLTYERLNSSYTDTTVERVFIYPFDCESLKPMGINWYTCIVQCAFEKQIFNYLYIFDVYTVLSAKYRERREIINGSYRLWKYCLCYFSLSFRQCALQLLCDKCDIFVRYLLHFGCFQFSDSNIQVWR